MFRCESKDAAWLWINYIQQAVKFSRYLKRLQRLVSDTNIDPTSKEIYMDRLQDALHSDSIHIKVDPVKGTTTQATEGTNHGAQSQRSVSTQDSAAAKGEDRISLLEKEVKEDKDPIPNSVGYTAFEIISQIGSGAFGQILKVRFKPTHEILAMKVFSKQFLLKVNQMRFALAECKALAQVSQPSIIT